ncbi:MAG TPA: Arm DNA-binding domain-containing protein, partial [Micromonosporaceae bacterium]|nr:Arm DNA-binding domain-containing protein [Micromonosporaceae bacterium]
RLAGGQTRWMFTIDLPPATDGRRRQMNRKGFTSQRAALDAETEARGEPTDHHGSMTPTSQTTS